MASGLHYTRRGGGPVGGESYRKMASELQNILADEMEVAGKESEGEAKGFVDAAGTGNTWRWSDRDGAPAGRVHSGTMRDALGYRITKGREIGLDVGWVDFWDTYFGAQDAGFWEGGARPGQWVEGMGMLAHLKKYSDQRIDMAMDRAIRRINNGL